MAKGSSKQANKHGPSALSPRAAPLKQKPHAAQTKHAKQQKGTPKHQHAAHADEEAHRRRALQRMEMGPSDDSKDASMSSEEGGGALHEQQANGHDVSNSEHEGYLRALRRMEMGPSDEEEGSSSQGEEESSEEGGQQGGGGRAQGSSRKGGPMGDSEESSSGSEEDDEMEEDTGAAGKASGQQQLGKGRAGSEDRDRLKGMGCYEGDSEGNSSGNEDSDDDEGDGKADFPGTAQKIGKERGQQQQQQQQQQGGSSGGSSSNSDQSEGGEDEEAAFLTELPLGERLALRTDGSGPGGNAAREAAAKAREAERNFKRPNKHRPQEASSKKPVPRLREVIKPAHKPGRDPRFAPVFNPAEKDQAAKRYSFVFDDVLPEDKNRLRTQLKQTRNERARAALSTQLQRVEQSLRQEQERRRNEKIESEWKAKERAALQSGAKTKPFFLKKGEKKKMALTARFQELKEKGQLDKYMEKRRKRNASKDHKKFPGSL